MVTWRWESELRKISTVTQDSEKKERIAVRRVGRNRRQNLKKLMVAR